MGISDRDTLTGILLLQSLSDTFSINTDIVFAD